MNEAFVMWRINHIDVFVSLWIFALFFLWLQWWSLSNSNSMIQKEYDIYVESYDIFLCIIINKNMYLCTCFQTEDNWVPSDYLKRNFRGPIFLQLHYSCFNCCLAFYSYNLAKNYLTCSWALSKDILCQIPYL